MNACRLCSSNDLEARYRINDVTVERCRSCGFVQVKDRPNQEDLLELYSPTYFDHGKYSDTFALNKENDRRLALMQRQRLPRGARVLDAGCATGDFLSHAKHDYDMWGLDISEFAVREAQQKNPEIASQIRSGLVENQDYQEGFFDAIVMWDVLEHLWDPIESCRKLLWTLKPGGCLFISTPNVGSLAARLMGRYWAFMTVPEHLGFCNRSTMALLLRNRLHMELADWTSKGKWVNCGFLLYKVKRIFPHLVPQVSVELLRARPFRRLAIYVPSGDIQYAVARKPFQETHSS